jgi:predicted secreted hydrolase
MRWLLLLFLAWPVWAEQPVYPAVTPGIQLTFPKDHGAHPAFRIEWWYVTGWLKDVDGKDLGFQVTFFRSRPPVDQDNPSRFAARQVIFAHAALSDPKIGHLQHDQKVARQGFGLAGAAQGNTDLVLDDWTLRREHDGRFLAQIKSLEMDLEFTPTQPPLAHGENGFSRKGPEMSEASYYYSLPHLKVSGTVSGRKVTGEAWLDHEWSSAMMDGKAVGWDWLGINLDDGGALMLFRLRDQDGNTLWTNGAMRPTRRWRSPRTGAEYPVEWAIETGGKELKVTPLFDDQELDARSAGGPVYWEGAVRVPGGRGYLELTGYLQRLTL